MRSQLTRVSSSNNNTSTSSPSSPLLEDGERFSLLMLQTLSPNQQRGLAPLSVFPCTFDEEGAAAVMGSGSKDLLQVLDRYGLLPCDSVPGQYHLHDAVRQALLKVADLQSAQDAFVSYMMRLLVRWGKLYQGPACGLALGLIREHAADLTELWSLMALRSEQAADGCSKARAVKTADLDAHEVSALLQGAGILGDSLPAWQSVMGCLQGDGQHEVQFANAAAMCSSCLMDLGKYGEAEDLADLRFEAVCWVRSTLTPSPLWVAWPAA